MTRTGLDVIRETGFRGLRGKRIGLLCHQASISSRLHHAMDIFFHASQEGVLRLEVVFGPQHGLWGHTQDNMIEWEGYRDKRTGLVIYSLYGKHRKPTPEMLNGLDVVVVDLQDVGTRYYTFIWTVALVMEACQEQGVDMVILDRPNPINGLDVEGPLLDMRFRSFVGLYPLLVRHGMTLGEIASYLKDQFFPDVTLDVVPMEGWHRGYFFDQTELPWAMPSPNMPTLETAIVYPGMCLLEATNISEGRGTTRPFEIFGAPWMDGFLFAEKLNAANLPAVYFRPIQFQPTFHKYAGEICQGCFIHVLDRRRFRPFLTGLAIIREALQCYPDLFRWKDPPYEYEFQKKPFDILVGKPEIRTMIQRLDPLPEIESSWKDDEKRFLSWRKKYLLYS